MILIFQAVVLGLAASLVGVILGDVLSRSLFHEVPSYLTLAFPIGTNPVIPLVTVLLALGCGVLATVLASLLPVFDLRRRRAANYLLQGTGDVGQSISRRVIVAAGVTGVLLLLAVTIVVLFAPSLSVVGGIVLALAAFCLILPLFMLVVSVIKPFSERLPGSMLALATVELDATATRSIALAGVAALAVYGMVVIQGARHDLIHGLDAAVVQCLDTADVWVTTDNNFLTIDSFQDNGAQAEIARSPEVVSAREYQGELLDVGTRRLWIRARPAEDNALIQASQLVDGNLAQATLKIRQGGWAAVSKGFAETPRCSRRDVHPATPSGAATFRIAAITTNVGWPPGAITLNDSDYQHYWQSTSPTALEITLKPGVTPQAGKRAVEQALGHRPGLLVQTLREREARFEASARQGSTSLSRSQRYCSLRHRWQSPPL